MPSAPPHLCRCGALIPAGQRCPRCQAARQQQERQRKADHDKHRPSARQRGYDREWERVRAAFLQSHPVCCVPGCGHKATDVDHIQSIREAPHRRLDPANLRTFCHSHHSARTARDQSFRRKGR